MENTICPITGEEPYAGKDIHVGILSSTPTNTAL